MYQEIKEQLEKEFPELPKFEEKFQHAYRIATDVVGYNNMEALKAEIRNKLNIELEKYLASKGKTRIGRWIRAIINLVKRK